MNEMIVEQMNSTVITVESTLTPEQWELADAMSAISEECYAAGWLSGLEYTLWRFMTYESEGGEWGRWVITSAELDNLRTLALSLGGWIVFDDDRGEVFLTFDEWQKEYEAHTSLHWPEWRMIDDSLPNPL